MRMALLPLDDRPYNLDYVVRLAAVAGVEAITPPRAAIGWFFTPGDTGSLADWLLDLPADVEAVVVAIDMLAYGGLLASRDDRVRVEDALPRLDALAELRRRRPSIEILAFDTIIRTSLSARDRESRRVHRLLHRWTALAHKAETEPDADTLAELAEVASAIPKNVIDRYLAVRVRKHAVNRRAVELVGRGVIDVLHLLMEDVGPGGDKFGVHKEEQATLLGLARDLGASERLFLHNGTDEGACTLLAHLLNSRRSVAPRVYVHYSAPDGATQVPTFEDRPLGKNVASFLAAAGCQAVRSAGEADAVLAVHAPYGSETDLAQFTDRVAADLAVGMPVTVVDTTTNRADPELMAALARRIKLDELAGFSAWNTACNSLGTALAQLVVERHGTSASGAAANRLLTIERLLDDHVYEGVVRPSVDAELEAAGRNPWDLAERADDVRLSVATRMQEAATRLLRPHVNTPFAFDVTLPWPRTFEPSLKVRAEERRPSY